MSTLAEVRMWGRTIGAVSIRDGQRVADFQYDPDFARSGIQVSPIVMQLSPRVYAFPELSQATYHGLPGLLADCLPDKFGNALIDTWLAAQGRTPDSFNAVERLCYTGERGMGALEFRPVTGPEARQSHRIEVHRLVELASDILTRQKKVALNLDDSAEHALTEMLRVGTSAGGARAKAIIAWNPSTNEVRSGQVPAGQGFEYWILKFDGVRGNRDKELEDPHGYGAIEYAYSRMAVDAGINMSPCRLFEENGRRHFMSRRFDRSVTGEKLHMQSLCALAHYDYNMAGAWSYEQALLIMRQLELPMDSLEQQFRRMVFNVIARNQDDHAKNIAFLMDKSGEWSLSPAFDVAYSYNPVGAWTARHQMTINGKSDGFTLEDFNACAKSASLKRGRAAAITAEVVEVVARWKEYAEKSGVATDHIKQIATNLRVQNFK